jgi:hypothetical protein
MIANESLFKCEISKIDLHREYSKFSEVIATTNYLMTLGLIVNSESLNEIILMHPIIVISVKKKTAERYYCIGGVRSWLIAKSVLGCKHEVPVVVLTNVSTERILSIMHADMLLSPLLNSVRRLSDVGAIYEKIGSDGIRKIFKEGSRSKEALARNMDCAKNSIFHPKPDGNETQKEETDRK